MPIYVKNDELKQILKLAKNLLDMKDYRPLCNALRFEFHQGICEVIATDSHRLGVFELPYSGEDIDNFTILYTPMDFGKGSQDIAITYQEGDVYACFSTTVQSVSVPIADLSYPNWHQLITMKEKPKHRLLFNRQSLLKTLQSTSDEEIVINIYGDIEPMTITDTCEKNTRLILPMLKNH